MKQAYTNTIRGGSRNPLTIAKKRGKQAPIQPPKCAYGAACNRKGCAYWHPPASSAPCENICKPFLAGLCSYGSKCMNRHPAKDEADAIRAAYKRKSCSYGDDCQTEGCLYWHPWEAADALESSDYDGGICSAVGGLRLEGGGAGPVHAAVPTPTYESWLALNCPSPPAMDENYAYNLWHYPGSGMQRSPWEVYCLMYQNYNNTTTARANYSTSSQGWQGAANSHVNATPQAPMVFNPDDNDQHSPPKTFQEWKKKGQPYPSWFCSDLDPWYDDEGVRRSLEEVYEVLYGDNAQEKFAKQQQQQAQQRNTENDPTPAELEAMMSTNNSQLSEDLQKSSVKGWASIVAKRPLPVSFYPAKNDASTVEKFPITSDGASNVEKKCQSVIIPKEVWLPSTANSDFFHLYPNPIERFQKVNNYHQSYLASITIPLCFDGPNPNISLDKQGKSGKVTLLDVHFQSAKTITPVLNRFLTPALKRNDEVWVVTGSGHHVAVGHQRREGGGVLFNAVRRYLELRAEDMALEFRVGKDTSGGRNKSSGGAFLVRRLS